MVSACIFLWVKNNNFNKPNLETSVKQSLFGKSHDSSCSEHLFFFQWPLLMNRQLGDILQIQSKSFKLLQRHLDHQEEEDGMFQKHFMSWTSVVASFHFNIIKWLDCEVMWYGMSWIEWPVSGYSIINCCFPDLPPPPPEAFTNPDDDSDKHVQSRTFKMLQNAVEAGGWAVFALFLTQATSTCILIQDVYPAQ